MSADRRTFHFGAGVEGSCGSRASGHAALNRQSAKCIRHDGEFLSYFSRPCRLDGRVERHAAGLLRQALHGGGQCLGSGESDGKRGKGTGGGARAGAGCGQKVGGVSSGGVLCVECRTEPRRIGTSVTRQRRLTARRGRRWPGSGTTRCYTFRVGRSAWGERLLSHVVFVQHGHLPEFVADSLAEHAAPLSQHWLERAAAAAPRPAPGTLSDASPDASASEPWPTTVNVVSAERVIRALAASVLSATAASLVLAGEHEAAQRLLGHPGPTRHHTGGEPAAGVSQDARPTAEVMRLGWAAGGAAYAAGHSIHHVMRDADLLLAVVLADVERVLADVPPAPGAGAADGLAVARRLQRATGRYAQAAVSGFVHAMLRGLRERYRLLRHDLRNPLGTIRSALSLMEDETVPVETRQGPNIRAMVARNAGSLDRLITRRLDDAAAVALLAPSHAVSVRDVALAARREVREAARLAGCHVTVEVPDDAPSRVDGAALELTLTTVLLAALAHATPGGRVRVRCADRAPDVDRAPGGADESGAPPDDVPGRMCVVLRVDLELPDGQIPCQGDDMVVGAVPSAVRTPCWDEQGLDLALALAHDHGGRLGLDAAVESAHDEAALVTALARSPTVFLRLPLIESGAAPLVRPPAVSGVGQ